MFKTKSSNNKKSDDVKKSAGKVLDTKKDTPTRAKVRRDRKDVPGLAWDRDRLSIVNIFSGVTCAIKCSVSNCLITQKRQAKCNFLPL